MESYLVHGGIGLGRGSLARIDDGRGMLVYLWDGEVHITQEGDPRDHFVRRGGSFRLERNGTALVYAVRGSALALSAPVPAFYARRITVAVPGRPARVIYERAGQRLLRFWASLYARHSLPTTAAL